MWHIKCSQSGRSQRVLSTQQVHFISYQSQFFPFLFVFAVWSLFYAFEFVWNFTWLSLCIFCCFSAQILIRCVRTVCCWMIAWVDVLCLPILEDVVSSLNGHWPMLKNHIERWKRSRKLCFLCTANECDIIFELLNRSPVCVNAMIGHVHCFNWIQMMRLFNYMLIMISFLCTLTQHRHTNMHSQ